MSAPEHPPLVRLVDWPERLAAFLHALEAPQQRFDWRDRHCVAFAAQAVHALTGWLPAVPAAKNERHALQLLRQHGGSLPAAVSRVLPRLATPWLAWRGDVLLIRVPHGVQTPATRWGRAGLALADGERARVISRTGLLQVPADWAVEAWGVGHA